MSVGAVPVRQVWPSVVNTARKVNVPHVRPIATTRELFAATASGQKLPSTDSFALRCQLAPSDDVHASERDPKLAIATNLPRPNVRVAYLIPLGPAAVHVTPSVDRRNRPPTETNTPSCSM